MNDCVSQFVFNTRTPVVANTIFNCVQVLNDGNYLVSGWTYDTIPNVHRDFCTMLFNEVGDPVSYKLFGDSAHQTFSQENTLSYVDNIFLQQGVGTRNGVSCALLFWFDQNGDTLRTKEIYSPQLGSGNFGEEFINPLYSLLMPDSTVYLSTVIFQPTTNNDVCIWHLDKFGNELWSYIDSTVADPDICSSLMFRGDTIIAAVFRNVNDIRFNAALDLIQLSSAGILIGTIQENTWDNFSYSIYQLLSENQYTLCAGSICESEALTARACVWKINLDGGLIWNATIGDYPELNNALYHIENLCRTSDMHYVGSGSYTWSVGDDSNSEIRLVKLDFENGTLLWERYYHYVESNFDIHQAIDLKATPDGGVVFCGHASDNDSSNPNYELPAQQGWIVKLDECGCLVPGCDETCIIGVNETENTARFKVGPNPASSSLNVFLSSNMASEIGNAMISIFDLQGKLIKSFKPHRADTTYILDVSDYASGEYVLTLMGEKGMLQSERIGICHE